MKRVLRDTTARCWRALSLTAAFVSCGLPLAHAAPPVPDGGNNTWTVTGNGEPATLGSATCNAGTHTCPTLRDAINTAISGDTVIFAAALDNATISLTLYSNLMGCVTSDATHCSGSGALGREFGPSAFFIDGRNITIDATALAHGVTLARDAAAANFRLFDVAPGSGLALKGLVLQNGVAKGGTSNYGGGALGAGGAIFNQGTLDVERCTFSGHVALGGDATGSGVGGGGVGADGSGPGSGVGGGPNGGGTGGSAGGFGGGGGWGDGNADGGKGGFGGGGGESALSGGTGGAGGFGGGAGYGYGFHGTPGFGGGGASHGIGGGAGMGGAIFNDAGTLTVSNSTFVGNRASGGNTWYATAGNSSGFGGAIFNYNGNLTLAFATLADNTVQAGSGSTGGSGGGTAIYSLGDSLAACSAGGNTCTSSGATLTMNMSIAARSQGSLKDVTLDAINGGTSTATGAGNFIAYTQALNGTSTGNLVTVNMQGITDPQLAATLDANGGIGLTLMPLPGSPLIDAAADAGCLTRTGTKWGCLTSPAASTGCSDTSVDQRGVARPQGALCDIGAVEVRGPRISAEVTTAGGSVSLSSPASLGGFGLAFCSPSNPDYCSTRVSSEAGAPDLTLNADANVGYHVSGMTSDCGATLDAQTAQIHIAALAADCTVHVAFAPNLISGSVQNLLGSGLKLILTVDNGPGENVFPDAGDTSFGFTTPVPAGSSWNITVDHLPHDPYQTCTATPTSGTMPADNVTDIVVACTTDTYTIGGNASGVDAPGLVLQLNGGDDLPVNANGTFTFTAPIASGANYAVTILSQPAGRSCTLVNASGSVGGANVTDVGVTCSALPALALSLSDDRDFARYGQVVDYVVTLANNGDGDATNVAVAFTLSAGFDGDYAQVSCFGTGGGASCVQDGANPLAYTVSVPAHRSLTWFIAVPVRADASDTAVEIGASADGAASITDTDTLVIFRDGFDVPYGDGTRSVPVVAGAPAKALLDGDALREVSVPTTATTSRLATPLLIVRDGAREVRIDATRLAGLELVRLLERDAQGRERATRWSVTPAGATLEFGSAPSGDDAASKSAADARDSVLVGADPALSLRH